MRFGELLLDHRRRALLSQEELGRRSGLSARSIRDLETGRVQRPRAASVRLLADTLQLTGEERVTFESAALRPPAATTTLPYRTVPELPDEPSSALPDEPSPAPFDEPSPAPPDDATPAAAARAVTVPDRLADSLLTGWREEINVRELGAGSMDVTWHVAPGPAADRAWRPVPHGVAPPVLPGADPDRVRQQRQGPATDLYMLYAALPGGRLVVRAGAGGGKTSALLLLLARALHARQTATPQDRARMPVAVLLSLTEWDPARMGLVDFAAVTLARDVPWLRHSGTGDDPLVDMINSGGIALFLDGLDEMAAGRAEAIARINAASHVRVVLATRPAEYAEATAAVQLFGALVVDLLPVGLAPALDFLRGREVAQGPWPQVLARLATLTRPGTAELTTPLYLSLLARCYRHHSPAELLDEARFPTADDVAARLVDAIIPQAYATGRPGRSAPAAQAWLAFLARRMTRTPDGRPLERPSTGLAWSQFAEWIPRWLAQVTDGLGFALVAAVAARTALAGSVAGGSPIGAWTAVVPALWGVVGGVAYLAAVWLDRRLTGVGVVGLSVGTAGAMALGLLGGVLLAARMTMLPPVGAVAFGLTAGVALGMGLSLPLVISGLRNPRVLSRRRWPSSFGRGKPSWRAAALLLMPCVGYLAVQPHVTVTEILLCAATLVTTVWCESLLSGQSSGRGPATARQSFRHDLVAWLSFGVLLGGCGGMFMSVVFGTALTALPGWFAASLLLTLLSSHSVAYLVAVTWFSATGQLPRSPMRFLDDAWRRGVLRRNGWRYEFRHKVLLDALGGQRDPDRADPPGAGC